MAKIRFIHGADFHLDNSFAGSSMDGKQRKQRRSELLDTFITVIDKALHEEVDFLLIGGDLFEHSLVKKSTIYTINSHFERIMDIPVFITPGNHDPNLINSYYQSFEWSPNVHIFKDEFEKVTLDRINTDIYGYGYQSYKIDDNPLEGLEIDANNNYKIVIFHGSNILSHSMKDDYLDFTEQQLKDIPVDYIALGHFHKYQEIGSANTRPRCVYSGCPEPLGFDEMGEKGVLLVELDDLALNIQFINTQKRKYHDLAIDITECSSAYQVREVLMDMVLPGDADQDFYNIRLTGIANKNLHLDITAINNWFSEKRYKGRILDNTQDDYDITALRREPGLVGMFVRKIQEQMMLEQDEERVELLKHALIYGLDALIDGEVRE